MYKKANAEADRLRLFYLNMKYLANLKTVAHKNGQKIYLNFS